MIWYLACLSRGGISSDGHCWETENWEAWQNWQRLAISACIPITQGGGEGVIHISLTFCSFGNNLSFMNEVKDCQTTVVVIVHFLPVIRYGSCSCVEEKLK